MTQRTEIWRMLQNLRRPPALHGLAVFRPVQDISAITSASDTGQMIGQTAPMGSMGTMIGQVDERSHTYSPVTGGTDEAQPSVDMAQWVTKVCPLLFRYERSKPFYHSC